MKNILLHGLAFSLITLIFCLSCSKEYSCEGCSSSNKPPITNNKAPIAIAGTDQSIIFLLGNTTNLDGSKSTDPDSNITSYLWTKVSGPSSFLISNPDAAETRLAELEPGVYHFELEVRDAGGLYSRDTVKINVVDGPIHRPVDTTFTDLVWTHWHPSLLPTTDTNWDEIYLKPLISESFFLNVPYPNIKIFVRTDPNSNWIEANRRCAPPYSFRHVNSTMYIESCPLDFTLVGKKAAIRLVIK